jgi:Protein of unknown function (DUF2800)
VNDPHHERSHAQWSASSTARNWTCSGAIAMATIAGPEAESESAARGTAAHTVAETCLHNGGDPVIFLGETVKTKEHTIKINEDIANSAAEFVDYIRAQDYEATLIEQNFSLAVLNPPFEAGGTCDVIGIKDDILEVVDLKHGMGLVEVNENKQTRTYALCALLGLPRDIVASIKTIKVTIVQPRAPHRDGRIRSETFHVSALIDWTVDLLERMNLSKQAFDEFQLIEGNAIKRDEWSDKWLTTGQCGFCRARGFCPKRRKEALANLPKVAQQWHEDVTLSTPVDLTNLARLGSGDEIAHDLDGFSAIEDWIKARRAYAHVQAENGVEIPGYQLSEKIGNRKWRDEAETIKVLAANNMAESQIFEQSLRTPAQIEKILGAKRKGEIDNLVHRPVTGTNLVSSAKTTRPVAKSLPGRFHEKTE